MCKRRRRLRHRFAEMEEAPPSGNNATSPSTRTGRQTPRSIRKREQDRLAQRASRQRTKQRIAQLEATVTALQGQDAGLLITSLQEQLEQVTSQRDQLSGKLAIIEEVVKSDDVDSGSKKPSERSPIRLPRLHNVETIVDREGYTQETIIPYPDVPCACTALDIPLGSSSCPSVWRSVNAVLTTPCSPSDVRLSLEDATSEDIPVRAILDGWDTIEKHGKLPLLWKKMRGVDELMYINCNHIERLAVMSLIHLLLRYHAEPTPERCRHLPPWLLNRPSQTLPHSYAIDFLVWPGVRERFVFSQHQYCDDQFWARFVAGFRIAWPFEFRDCYRINIQTGEFSISPEFYRRIFDLRAWTMSTDFFAHFPEMYADIPALQEIPTSLTTDNHWMRRGGTMERSNSRDNVDDQLIRLVETEGMRHGGLSCWSAWIISTSRHIIPSTRRFQRLLAIDILLYHSAPPPAKRESASTLKKCALGLQHWWPKTNTVMTLNLGYL